MSAPRLCVPSLDAGQRSISLPPGEAHHVVRVLRLGPGDLVRLFDGRGREWRAQIVSAGRAGVSVDVGAAVAPAPEPPVRVTLAVGVLKGDQMDAVVRDATAMGVTAIVPMVTAHVTVPGRAWRSGAAIERWRRVAVASAKQCGRAVVPEIAAVSEFRDVVGAARVDRTFICVEPSRAEASIDAGAVGTDRPSTALVLVGPEGGWSAEELAQARGSGALAVHLGPRTLRAETVPTVILSALWTMWGW